MLASNRFLHWPTALSVTFCNFCNMLAHVSMRCCFKSLVTVAGIADRSLYNIHTFLHQSTNSVVNLHQSTNSVVQRTQICWDKVWCFLLEERDCLTSDVKACHFWCSCSKANKVSKSEGIRKIDYTYHFLEVCWCCLPRIIKISPCLSKLQLAKVDVFFETVYFGCWVMAYHCSGLPLQKL